MHLIAKGATVTCVEISKTRIATMKENFQRTKSNPKIICSDVLKFETNKKFDFILLDAPCSATGTIRKNPDLIHIKDINDINRNVHLQQLLLKRAMELLSDKGVLVYCVCSLEFEEGEGQINALLEQNEMYRQTPIQEKDYPQYKAFITKNGFIRTLPHLLSDGGIDGFFISKLHKKF